jgi:glycosyltransferase involved in cell wall biosynthesis
MTRILMITDGRFSDRIRVSNEARALVEAGHEVHVHALDSWCEGGSFEVDSVSVTEHRLPKWCHWARVMSAEWPFYAWAVSRVLRPVLASGQADVIHVHNLFVWAGARRAMAAVTRATWVLDIAENLPEIMQEYDHVKRGLGRLLIRTSAWAALQKRALQESDRVVLVTQVAVEDYVARLGLQPSKALSCDNVPWDDHIGVDGLDELRARFEGAFVLFYFGDTSRRRGTDLAMAAMPELLQHVPNAHLVIVGKNNREDVFLAALRDQSPAKDRIHLEGFQPMSKLGSYLAVASVGLSPLVRNVHHDTTHANKLFQFMHGGLPLIVSDCTAQASLVTSTSTGLVHPAGDARALAQAAIHIATHPEEALAMGNRGRAAVAERFNWAVEIQAYVNSVCR